MQHFSATMRPSTRPSRPSRIGRLAVSFCLFLFVAPLLYVLCPPLDLGLDSASTSPASTPTLSAVLSVPKQVHLPPRYVASLPTTVSLIRPSVGCDIGVVLHALHAFACCPELLDHKGPTYHALKTVLLDEKVASSWYKGQLSMLRTKYGYRYVTARLGRRSPLDNLISTKSWQCWGVLESIYRPRFIRLTARLLWKPF